jgi:ketosteroid isomerase-like protein
MAEHPNVERMRMGYEAFAAGDLDTLRNERFAPDIVFHVTNSGSLSGDYKGVDEVFGFFGKLMEETDGTFRLEVHDLLANDEHTIGLVRTTATRKGKTLEQNAVHVFHVNAEGKITENWTFAEDTAAANEFFS